MATKTRKKKPFRRVGHVTVQKHRDIARIWLEGKYLLRAGFEPKATITAEYLDDRVVVRLDEGGERKVSAKGGTLPIIEIANEKVPELFEVGRKVEVRTEDGEITICRIRTESQKRRRVRNGLEGSAFSGGGLLSEASRQAGLRPSFAIEIDPRYASIFEANHPEAEMLAVPVEQIRSEWIARHPVELVTLGVPCQPFSKAWRNTDGATKRAKGTLPESHDLGHMTFWALRLIDMANPYTAVIENVPGYLNSGAYHILHGALSAMGYNVEARVLSPVHFGGMTNRPRAVILAHTEDEIRWPAPYAHPARRLAEILHTPDHPEVEWFNPETKAWLYRHWERQAAKGNGFISQVVTPDMTCVPTIKKGYMKGQGDNPVVGHPTLADTHRWFTLTELKRIHGLPDHYDLGPSKTLAGEIIGQGVDVNLFRQVVGAVTGRTRGVTVDALDRALRDGPPAGMVDARGQINLFAA